MARVIDRFESSLDQISRKFIRRTVKDSPEGYNNLKELSTDIENAIDILLSFDPTSKPLPSNSEFWIRITNDYISDVEDWPLTADMESYEVIITNVRRVCARLNNELVARSSVFTQTQRTRLLSLALRARQCTQEQLFTDTVDAFGESLV